VDTLAKIKIPSEKNPTKLFFSFRKRKEKFDQKKRKFSVKS
jgi:hypothetical protein